SPSNDSVPPGHRYSYKSQDTFLVRKPNCGSGGEGCRKNVEFGPSAYRRCWTGTRGLQVDIDGLRAELRINYRQSGEKINLKLRRFLMSAIRDMRIVPESA